MNQLLNDFMNPTKITETETHQIKSIHKVSDVLFKFTFGKHNGETVEKILKEDPGYIIWVHDKFIQGIRFSQEIMTKAVKANNDPLEDVFGPMPDEDLMPF